MSQKKQKQLTSKRKRFVDEYIIDFNGTRAAKAAGFSESTASAQAYNLLQTEQVQDAISKALKTQQKRTQTDADKIVEEYAKVAFANIKDFYDTDGNLKDIQDLDPLLSASIKKVKETEHVSVTTDTKRITREFELHDKLTALRSLGDHFRIFDKEKPIEPTEINVNVKIKRKKK